MAQCPVCDNVLPDDFGLIECGQCKTPLFVQMDGTVQSMPQDATVAISPEEMPEEDGPVLHHIGEQTQVSDLGIEMAINELMEEESADPESIESEIGAESPVPEESQMIGPDPGDVDAFFDGEEPPPLPAPEPEPINDLSNLANSVDLDGQGGALRYTVSISGIDTADIRKEFRELISDRRFLWDVDMILKSIRAGKVKMENITAVKALLLVHRLRSLPVQIQWEQHVVHQM